MIGFARKILLVSLLAACATLPAGCRTFSRRTTEAVLEGGKSKQWHVRYGSQSYYSLNDEGLAKIDFEGLVDADRVRVRYQRGMQAQARCIAQTTTDLLGQVEQQVGLTIGTSSMMDLLRFDEPPQSFDIQLTVEPNEFLLPLFVRAGDESCTSIMAQNRSYPYVLVHELVETSLTSPKGGRVLPDLSWGPFGLNFAVNNHTRWFRDGLSNYAGYIACEIVSDEMDCPECPTRVAALLHASPFSALSRIGTRLFSWSQSSHTDYERAYYNAALGLFLLIENRFGEQAIRDILAEVATQDTVDGRDLTEIASRVIGSDIRQLVADFEFPMVGAEFVPVSQALAANKGLDATEGLVIESIDPDGPAHLAGLRTDDVIVAVDSVPVADTLDFELALFRAGRGPSLPLAIWRKDVGTIATELPLRFPGRGRGSSGRRLNPLKKGRIDFFGVLPFIP